MGKQQTFKDFESFGKEFGLDNTNNKKEEKKKREKQPNLGWLFYKDYYAGLENLKDDRGNNVDFLNNKKANEVGEFFSEKNKKIIDDYSFSCGDNSIKDSIDIKLKTIYPGLITGIGINHETGLMGEIKLGFQFDYTTGIPYIPGSSVKGLLRSAFPFSLKVKTEKEQEKNVIDYRNNRYAYIADVLKNLKNENDIDISINVSDNEIKALEYAIFAGTDEKGKALECTERDVFLDAMISKASKKGIIGTDFITPHIDPLKDPNPIQFFKILPKNIFQFSFKFSDTILYKNRAYTIEGFEKLKIELSKKENFDSSVFEKAKKICSEIKKALFRQILLDFGIGAKTNVGYGQFSNK